MVGCVRATARDCPCDRVVGRGVDPVSQEVSVVAPVAELPAVQALAERLDHELAGAVLEHFRPDTSSVLKTVSPKPSAAYRHPVAFVGRRASYLLIDFGVITFVVNVSPGGGLQVDGHRAVPPSVVRARWRFTDGRACVLVDGQTDVRAGVWVVADDPEQSAPLESLGPDATEIPPGPFLALLHSSSMRLNEFLREQHLVAGLGHRLAAEVCHRARLSPFASTAELGSADAEALIEAIHACVNQALADERGRANTSIIEERRGNVHHRVGERCPVCGDVIGEVEQHDGTVAYCPTCQTGGRILAD